MKRLLFIILLFCPLVIWATDYNVTADSYVRDDTYSGTNYGTDIAFKIKNCCTNASVANRKGFLKFDLSSYSLTGATSAKLHLYSERTDSAYGTLYECEDDSWTETGITWDNQPATSTKITNFMVSSTPGWLELDVRTYVNTNIVSGNEIVSFVIYDETQSSTPITITSKEASSNHPYLAIEYVEDRKDIMLCIEERMWSSGCGGKYTGRTHYLKYPTLDYWNMSDSVFCHVDNNNYNDSGQSVVVGNTQYQVNCCYRSSNPINMFIRNFSTKTVLDSLIIYGNQDSERLTLLGINLLPGTDTLLVSGYERYEYGGADADDNYGIYKWLPDETTAYYCYDTGPGGSGNYGMNGMAVRDSFVYITSEKNNKLEKINTNTWSTVETVTLASAGNDNRGCTIVEGDTVIVVCDKNNKDIHFYNLNDSYALIKTVAFDDYLYNSGNLLYGSWFVKLYRKTPIITRK